MLVFLVGCGMHCSIRKHTSLATKSISLRTTTAFWLLKVGRIAAYDSITRTNKTFVIQYGLCGIITDVKNY